LSQAATPCKSFEPSELPFSLESTGKVLVAGLARELSSGGSSACTAAAGCLAPAHPEQHAALSEDVICWHDMPTAWHIWKKNCSIIIA